MKQHLVRITLGLAITLFFIGHAARWYQVGFISQLDNIIYDARLRLTMPRGVDPRIVILDIDEKSLQEVARWPWPRDVMARLIEKLFTRYEIALLGFDVVFPEADYSSGIKVLDEMAARQLKTIPAFHAVYERLRPQLDNDGLFARAIHGRPVVLGYYLNSEKGAKRIAEMPEPVLPKGSFSGRHIAFTSWEGYGGNLKQLLSNATAAGHINAQFDEDGVVRRVPMIVEFDGAYYEALSLAMVRALLGFPRLEPGFPADGKSGLEWLKLGPVTVPVDDEVGALVPYRGGKFSFPYISLADVLGERVQPEALRGRIALIGTTAPGLHDLRATPVDSLYPGVEIHANLIAGMLDRALKHKPPFMLRAEVTLLMIGGMVLAMLIPMLSALSATATAALGLVLIVLFNLAVWTHANMVLPLASAILMIAFVYTMNMAYGYFVESRSKRQFTELFGQYVPPELVDRMAADPGKYNMEPRNAELTILFCDVREFTSISEALTPEELREYLNDYLTAMSAIIRSRYRGTLDKYIGDAIMAFWGAPMDDAQHARNAVLAALEMQKECDLVSARFAARGWPPLKIGIGVNTGVVRVGDMGSQVRRAYTAVGDAVNVASRLEGRTKDYGVGVLVGESTRRAVHDVLFREVDRIKVKGKDEALTIYEPIALESKLDGGLEEELRRWREALERYRARDWEAAHAALQGLPSRELYRRFAQKMAETQRLPLAADWDGITVFDEK